MLGDISASESAQERADTDDDGEAEQSVVQEKRMQQQHLRRDDSRARPPKQAAEYRATEVFDNPLRTAGLIIGYEVVFLSVAVAITFTDLVSYQRLKPLACRWTPVLPTRRRRTPLQ